MKKELRIKFIIERDKLPETYRNNGGVALIEWANIQKQVVLILLLYIHFCSIW